MKVLSWNPKTKNVGKLCALVAKEQDHEKLAELTGEIVRLLKAKLDGVVPPSGQSKSSKRTKYL